MALNNDEYQRGGYLESDKSKVHGLEEFDRIMDSMIFTRKEKTQIVEQGMDLVTDAIKKETPELDHSKYPWADKLFGKDRRIKHLEDAITYKPGEKLNGGTYIGFTKDAYPIARWVNWGTYRQEPQFFMEKAFKEIDFQEVFKRQTDKAIEISARKRRK